MTHVPTLAGAVLATVLSMGMAEAGPLDPSHDPHPDDARIVHEAEQSVDQAWETYHRAALGGTIASPAVQEDVEQHLHEARSLVTQAQEAADRGSRRKIESYVEQIRRHTHEAIKGSMEHKP